MTRSQALRRSIRFQLSALACAAIALAGGSEAVRAQTRSPASALRSWNSTLFAPGTLVDAAESGITGARVVQVTDALARLGFRERDVIVGVDGRSFAEGAPVTRGPDAVYTVLRAVPGERPVLPPEVLAVQVLRQFAALPEVSRTPMRLARMTANQRTLVRDGIGVVLVPAAANERDEEWLRVANPLPAPSEAAVRDIADAVRSRTSLSSSPAEDEAALGALGSEDFFEARERAARWIFGYVADPENRHARAPLDTQLDVFEQATRGVERERRILMATGRRFGAFVQGGYHRVKENLPQNTLLILDGSNSVSFAAGLRMGLFWPTEGGGWPLWRDLHLRGAYGYARHTFNGPPAQQQEGSEPRMRTRAHRISGELMYRPRVLSRIRPHFRGGPAAFYITASAYDTEDRLRERVQNWELGWVLGAGMDAWSSTSRNVRLTVTFDYQIVSTRFCEAEAPAWEDATNFIELPPPENRPQDLRCLQFSRSTLAYEVDLEGFQAGLALSYDF